jgi:hypothetical protein
MSTENRLARLGLLHLKDDPEALHEALAKGIAERNAQVAAWRAEQDAELRRSAWLGSALDRLRDVEPEPTTSPELVRASVALFDHLHAMSGARDVGPHAFEVLRDLADKTRALLPDGADGFAAQLVEVASRVTQGS